MTGQPQVLPYGSWPTPITSELVVRALVGLGEVVLCGDDVWWAEQRPQEGGRTQLVRWSPGGTATDVLPAGANARTAVHEYGGGAWWVHESTVWYAEWSDQRVYRRVEGQSPEAVTAEPDQPRADRWADGCVHPDGTTIAVVREHHSSGGRAADVRNEIVVLPAAGGEPEVVVSGPDFVSDPRWSPDGTALCWLEWDHPDMPWDSTRLRVRSGAEEPRLVAGGPGESVVQPRWAPDGTLWFASDSTGWWNLYRWTPGGEVEPMVSMDAEIGKPAWVFGRSSYAFLDSGRVVFVHRRGGADQLAVRGADGRVTDLDLPYTVLESVQATGDTVVVVAASPSMEAEVVRLRLDADRVAEVEVLRPARDLGLDSDWFAVPEHIEFPTSGGCTAYALFYRPTNPQVSAPTGELPRCWC